MGESQTEYRITRQQQKIAREQGRPINEIINVIPASQPAAVAAQIIHNPNNSQLGTLAATPVKVNTRSRAAKKLSANVIAPRHSLGNLASSHIEPTKLPVGGSSPSKKQSRQNKKIASAATAAGSNQGL